MNEIDTEKIHKHKHINRPKGKMFFKVVEFCFSIADGFFKMGSPRTLEIG